MYVGEQFIRTFELVQNNFYMTTSELPEIKFLGSKDFEEMDIPPIIYKYRDWENKSHRQILKKREIYFAQPNSFEDPLDCHIPRRFDLLTDDDILDKYRRDLKKENPNLDGEEIEAIAKEWFDKGFLRDEKRIQEMQDFFWQDFNKRYGICCLTPVPDSKEMWDKYSNHLKGFCVGFHSLILFKDKQHVGGGGPVSYFQELPTLIPFKEEPMVELQRQIYSKEEKWSFEKEYRLSKIKIKNRSAKIPKEAYAEVIIGSEIQKNYKKDIIRIVTNRLPDVKLKETYIIDGVIKIRKIN